MRRRLSRDRWGRTGWANRRQDRADLRIDRSFDAQRLPGKEPRVVLPIVRGWRLLGPRAFRTVVSRVFEVASEPGSKSLGAWVDASMIAVEPGARSKSVGPRAPVVDIRPRSSRLIQAAERVRLPAPTRGDRARRRGCRAVGTLADRATWHRSGWVGCNRSSRLRRSRRRSSSASSRPRGRSPALRGSAGSAPEAAPTRRLERICIRPAPL